MFQVHFSHIEKGKTLYRVDHRKSFGWKHLQNARDATGEKLKMKDIDHASWDGYLHVADIDEDLIESNSILSEMFDETSIIDIVVIGENPLNQYCKKTFHANMEKEQYWFRLTIDSETLLSDWMDDGCPPHWLPSSRKKPTPPMDKLDKAIEMHSIAMEYKIEDLEKEIDEMKLPDNFPRCSMQLEDFVNACLWDIKREMGDSLKALEEKIVPKGLEPSIISKIEHPDQAVLKMQDQLQSLTRSHEGMQIQIQRLFSLKEANNG